MAVDCDYENGEECRASDGTLTGEIAVHEFDAEGNFIGWHKEPKDGPVIDPHELPRGEAGWNHEGSID